MTGGLGGVTPPTIFDSENPFSDFIRLKIGGDAIYSHPLKIIPLDSYTRGNTLCNRMVEEGGNTHTHTKHFADTEPNILDTK